MRVLRSRLQHPRSKQHIAQEALEDQAEIEAENSCRGGDGRIGDKPGRNGDQQGRDDGRDWLHQGSRLQGSCHPLDTGTWHPARVQWQVPPTSQSGFHHRDHAGRSQRGVQQIGALTLAPQGGEQAVGGTTLERHGEAWSLVERTWVTT